MASNQFIRLIKCVPLRNTLDSYNWPFFNSDIFAGIITAILLIPQGMAYALLAGLPVEVGIYSSLLPAVIYAIFGTSRILSVGPVSIAAIMVASALSSPEIMALGTSTQNALLLALEGGVILCLMSAFKMGSLVNYISQPVLSGFTSGAAIIIIWSQLPNILGIHVESCTDALSCFQQSYKNFNIYEMWLGLMALITIALMGKPFSKFLIKAGVNETLRTGISKSAPLLSVILGILFVTGLALDTNHNVAVVGSIPEGLPSINFNFMNVSIAHLIALLPSAFFISLIAYVESVAIAKVIATKRNEKINPNQELIALGTANIASSISGGMPVAGGFSRTMVNLSAGAQSQIAMLVAVLIISLVIVTITSTLEAIPKAILAAIIILAVSPLIEIKKLISVWREDKSDGISQILTLCGVLVFGIEEGIMLGVVVTIFCHLRRSGNPHIAVVGRIKNTEHFRNVKRHRVETWKDLLFIRIDENITFANINYISDFIEKEAIKNQPKHIVLIFSSVSYIDTTAIIYFRQLINNLKKQHVSINLSEVKGPVIDKLDKIDFFKELLPGRVFFKTTDAVNTFTKLTD